MATSPRVATVDREVMANLPNSEVQKSMESLQEQVVASMDRYKQLQSKYSYEMNACREQIEEKDKRIVDLENQLSSQLKERDKCIKQCKDLQREVNYLRMEMKAKEDEVSILKNKIQQLLSEINHAQNQYLESRQQLSASEDQASLYEKIVDRSQKEVEKYRMFALNAKQAQYKAALAAHKEMIAAVGEALKVEAARFASSKEIMSEVAQLCRGMEGISTDYAADRDRITKAFKEKENQLKSSPEEFTLDDLPVLSLSPVPNIITFYSKLLERLTSGELLAQCSNQTESRASINQSTNAFSQLSLQSKTNGAPNCQSASSAYLQSEVNTAINRRASPSANTSSSQADIQPASNTSMCSIKGPPKKKFERLVPKIKPYFNDLAEETILDLIEQYHFKVGSFSGLYHTKLVKDIKNFIDSKYNSDSSPPVPPNADKREADLLPTASNMCTICLEKFEDPQSLHEIECGHSFHHDCIVNWMSKNYSCPNCRAFVLPREEFPQLTVN